MAKHEHEGCACCHSHEEKKASCGCGHEHEHEEEHGKLGYALYFAAVILFILGFFFTNIYVKIGLSVAAVLIAGYDILWEGAESLFKLKFNEELLLSIAVVAAMILGETTEAVAVLLLFKLGEFLEDYAIRRSQKEIDSLTDIQAEHANLMEENGEVRQIEAEETKVGNRLLIRAGERVPVDCVIVKGTSSFDTASVTGESVPQNFTVGERILSGMVNINGAVEAEAVASYDDSTASKIIELVRMGNEQKGKTQKFVTRFAAIYTPVVVCLAVVLAILPPLLRLGDFNTWIMRALIFLVASCPCAIVISVPLSFFSALGSASKRGVLIKGTKDIETLSQIRAVVFDKTGTLTNGKLSVEKVFAANGYDRREVLELAAAVEKNSTHPIAAAILSAAGETKKKAQDVREIAGKGLEATVDGKKVLCGTARFLEENGIAGDMTGDYNVFVAADGKLIGMLSVEDTVRSDSKPAIEALKNCGVRHTAMLTGDHESSAKKIADACGIEEHYSRLLPEDKCARLKELQAKYGKCAFVGDGINDAPVLTQSDVGIAPALASDIAAGAADVVLSSNKLTDIAAAVRISKKAMATVRFNVTFALIVKAAVLISDIFGVTDMWMAVLADVGVTLIAILIAAGVMFRKEKS